MKYIDKSECHWNSPKDYLATEIIGICGCGSSEELTNDIWNLFEKIAICSPISETMELIYKDKYHELIAHLLDHNELTEHGTSIGGSWISEKGEELYKELKKYL